MFGDLRQFHQPSAEEAHKLAWPGLEGELHPILRAEEPFGATAADKADASHTQAGWPQVEERCGLNGRAPFSLAGHYSAGYALTTVQPFTVGVIKDQEFELAVLEVRWSEMMSYLNQ